MKREIVVRPCISEGCPDHGAFGVFNRYACGKHRHLLERKSSPPPAPVNPKEKPIGDLFAKED